jgi:hypothetical protein
MSSVLRGTRLDELLRLSGHTTTVIDEHVPYPRKWLPVSAQYSISRRDARRRAVSRVVNGSLTSSLLTERQATRPSSFVDPMVTGDIVRSMMLGPWRKGARYARLP